MPLLISSRRSFLAGLAGVLAAPAIVRASSLMPISASKLWTPPTELVGAIKQIAGGVPSGWVLCDGRWLIRERFSSLYAVMGDKYGQTSPSGTFHVPNMEGQYGSGIGRFMVYAGSEADQHRATIKSITDEMKVRPMVWDCAQTSMGD